MKGKLISLAVSLTIFLMVSSCINEPGTKDEYMAGFGNFIQRVKQHYREYNPNDWKWADSRFGKYTSEWYENFKEDLSEVEKAKVAGWIIEYESFKGRNKIRDFYRKFLKEDVDNTGKDIKEYLKEDLSKDLSNAMNGAKEIGDSAVKVLDDIVRELKKGRN